MDLAVGIYSEGPKLSARLYFAIRHLSALASKLVSVDLCRTSHFVRFYISSHFQFLLNNKNYLRDIIN